MGSRTDVQDSGTIRDVHAHFEATAARFNAIYSSPRFLDRYFRRDMFERFQRTLDACDPIKDKSVLDVGCGSGQYAVALATRGAGEVVGLDFARPMVELAAEHARRAGVSDRCRFVSGEFLSYDCERRFDYLLAVGVFDYLNDPLPFLIRSRELTQHRFIATFPRLFTWRAPIRKVRLRLSGCPVYFYTSHRVRDLVQRAGFVIERFEKCGKLYWIAARPNSQKHTQ